MAVDPNCHLSIVNRPAGRTKAEPAMTPSHYRACSRHHGWFVNEPKGLDDVKNRIKTMKKIEIHDFYNSFYISQKRGCKVALPFSSFLTSSFFPIGLSAPSQTKSFKVKNFKTFHLSWTSNFTEKTVAIWISCFFGRLSIS